MAKDSALIEEWLTEHGDYLLGFAYTRLNGDREMAHDLIQETFIAAWKGYDNFAGESSVRTWLTAILKHKIIDHIRKKARTEDLAESAANDPSSHWFDNDGRWRESPTSWGSNPETLYENGAFHKVLQGCIQKLPALQGHVFSFRELNGDSSATICKNLDISSSNFHVLMHRARMSLRSCLEHHWFGRRS